MKTTELLKILPQKPAFGDKTGKTRWLFFVKDNHFGRRSNQKTGAHVNSIIHENPKLIKQGGK